MIEREHYNRGAIIDFVLPTGLDDLVDLLLSLILLIGLERSEKFRGK